MIFKIENKVFKNNMGDTILKKIYDMLPMSDSHKKHNSNFQKALDLFPEKDVTTRPNNKGIDSLYSEYVWKDGAYGAATLGTKGIADYRFYGDQERTKRLYEMKVGESVSFKDEYWGHIRTVTIIRSDENFYAFGCSPIPERDWPATLSTLFCTEHEGINFRKNLKKALTFRHWSLPIHIILAKDWNERRKSGIREIESHRDDHQPSNSVEKVIEVYLYQKDLEVLKVYWNAHLETKNITGRDDSYWLFDEDFKHINKVMLDRRAALKFYIYDGINKVRPSSVKFIEQ